MRSRHPITLLLLSTLVLVGACASGPSRNDMVGRTYDGRASESIRYGTVSGIEVVSGSARTSGGGAVLGAVIGAVVGNQIGSGSGRTAATGVGAVGGALIGNELEKRRQDDGDFYRIRVRYDQGGTGAFNYQHIGDLRVGDRVRVEGGQLARY
jgi:outer membrane lipoprotein SlyB